MNSYEIAGFVIDLTQTIGRGSYASVFPCRKANEQAYTYCCKILDLTKLSQQDYNKQKVERECQILNVLMERSKQNANVVAIYLIERIQVDNETKLTTIMERCDHDFRVILKQGKMNPDLAYNYMKQIIIGYKICYDHEVMHRDIKPENILVKQGNLKLADFGEGKILKDLDKIQNNTKKVGTPAYQSPQVFAGTKDKKAYSNKSDVYSLGVIFYEMLFGKTPFEHNQRALIEFHEQLKNNSFADKLRQAGLDQVTLDLLLKMLAYEEEQRIGWQELFSHPKFSIRLEQSINLKSQFKQPQQQNPNKFNNQIGQPLAHQTANQIPNQTPIFKPLISTPFIQAGNVNQIKFPQQNIIQQTPAQLQTQQESPTKPVIQLQTIQQTPNNNLYDNNPKFLLATCGNPKTINYYSLESALQFLIFLIHQLKKYQLLLVNLRQPFEQLINTLKSIGYTISCSLKKIQGYDITQFKMINPNPNKNQKPIADRYQEQFNYPVQTIVQLDQLQIDLVALSKNLVELLRVDPNQQYPIKFILMYNELVKITQGQRDFTSIENSFNKQCPFEIINR